MVKDIIMSAARLLGCEQELRYYFEDEDEEYEDLAALLLHCFQLVENELALDYLPLLAEQSVRTDDGEIAFAKLSRPAVRIVKVSGEDGEALPYTLFPDRLRTEKGRVTIVYAYAPEEKTWEDESEFSPYTSSRLFEYGVAAEYCTAAGRFEEAKMWEQKYKAAVESAYRMNGGGRIPPRGWV